MKMSDALRGAAETAPIGRFTLSVGAVKSRAGRNRALRSGANGLVGVGAAALVFAGVMGVISNQTTLASAEGTDSGKVAAPNVGVAGASDVSSVAGGREHMRRHF